MGRGKANLFTRVWLTLADPRVKTLIAIIAYTAIFAIGVALVIDEKPVRADEWFAGAFLVPGAMVGIPAAWRGAQWLEHIAAAAILGGLAVQAAAVILWLAVGLSDQVVFLAYITLAVAFIIYRIRSIRDRAYAPGRGPISPVDQAKMRADLARAGYEQAQADLTE